MNQLAVPSYIEIIFCDDGSIPAIKLECQPNFEYQLLHTNNYCHWTIASSFNHAAKHARGEYLFFTGIDHMISREFIWYAIKSHDEWATAPRQYAILETDGTLKSYYYIRPPVSKGWMSKQIFERLNGFDEVYDGVGKEDLDIRRRYLELTGIMTQDIPQTALIYMYPEKRHQSTPRWIKRPNELFHSLPDLFTISKNFK